MNREQLQINKKYGTYAETYANWDFIEHGFSLFRTNGFGSDFVASNGKVTYVVEVKFNNSRLTKKQKKLKFLCRRIGVNYFVYRVSLGNLQEVGLL